MHMVRTVSGFPLILKMPGSGKDVAACTFLTPRREVERVEGAQSAPAKQLNRLKLAHAFQNKMQLRLQTIRGIE
jgi:hypothetical protein